MSLCIDQLCIPPSVYTFLRVNVYRPIMRNSYCVMCFEITNDIHTEYEADEKTGSYIYCNK